MTVPEAETLVSLLPVSESVEDNVHPTFRWAVHSKGDSLSYMVSIQLGWTVETQGWS